MGFSSYNEAKSYYNNNIDNYDNLLLLKNGSVINMEYGVVEFAGNDNLCEYFSTSRNCKDYICGLYGIDGAYLYSNNDSQSVYFMVSGDIGYTSINNVILHPYEELNCSISSYNTKNNYLYHNIMTQLKYDYFTNSLCLDIMPAFMENDSEYYSYDGHYFYEDFKLMIDDYKNGVYTNAVNSEAYYNYYQYLPHRSLTNYSLQDLENYFYNVLCINGRLTNYLDLNNDSASDEVNRSQFYGNINEFFINQYMYGSNAMLLISSGIVESNYGKSLNSYIKNNLYLNAAYDSEHENLLNRYDSIANSIYSHSKYYISEMFSNHLKSTYYGTYLGNKKSGINVEYSLDHYYGEKVASAYFGIDKQLGFKDYNSLSIAILNNIKSLTIYTEESLSKTLFTVSNKPELAYTILKDCGNSYKIQIDDSFSNDYLYDFDVSVGYISKESVSYVLNEDSIHSYTFKKINYDFVGGEYRDNETLSLKVLENSDFIKIKPTKEGCELNNYNGEMSENGHLVYKANYYNITKMDIGYLFNKANELLPYPDLNNAYIKVTYDGLYTNKIPINSDMITAYNTTDENQTISVNYCGLTLDKEISLDLTYFDNIKNLKQAIENADYNYVKDNMKGLNYPFSMSEIRSIDYELQQANKRNYIINDKTNSYNISISGLDLSLPDKKKFSFIEDTYYAIIDDSNYINTTKIENLGKGYGFETVTGINISFKFNYQKIDLNGPAIVQLDIDDKKSDCIYTVYHVDDNGDIIKSRTTQSDNYIQFVIYEDGDYVVLSMPGANNYHIDDMVEDLSYENMGFDNNRVNLEFMLGIFLILLSLIGILIYYVIYDLKDTQWKDFRKSLQKVDIVQEEKQNN